MRRTNSVTAHPLISGSNYYPVKREWDKIIQNNICADKTFPRKYFAIQKIITIFAPRKAITLRFVTSKVKN